MRFMRQLRNITVLTVIALSAGSAAFAQYQGQPQYQAQAPMGAQPMYAPQGAFAPAGMNGSQPVGMQQGAPGASASLSVGQWFTRYDQIRFDAQMSPQERQQADSMMSHGLSLLLPGDTKIATKQLLSTMVSRYQRACAQLRALPQIAPTQQLQTSYYNYFVTAGQLFADYLRVQDNMLVTDATTGQPLAAGLLQRKQMLENIERNCKQIDAQARQQFGIPAYQY